ncbi:hypothetical protein E2542_SST03038 [Spatholobus suberectus]|nr:hypothetical protein E2542_SST03038 [Spatholobus suberectus]
MHQIAEMGLLSNSILEILLVHLGSKGYQKTLRVHRRKLQNCPQLRALLSGKAADEVNDGVDELITIYDDEAHSPSGSSWKLLGKNNVACDKVQTLILVEDCGHPFS